MDARIKNKKAKTKIVATLGPASANITVIRKLILAGMDIARLNFSHGDRETHLDKINIIRELNEKYRRNVNIMQDLEGFRIRIRKFKGEKTRVLKKNSIIYINSEKDTGEEKIIPFDYEGDLSRIKKGQIIYIDDGNIIFEVLNSSKKQIKAKVREGTLLKERKGVNMPGVKIPFRGVTDKDLKDLEFGIEQKVDYVAQSFVRTKKDIDIIKEKIKGSNSKSKVIAKIESVEAIKNIDEIIEASDAIMIARGDMGVAIPIYEVPLMQKMIIKKCNKKKKMVITATQMLENMTEHSRPTRAEVTDVANAVLDGTDCVMLSAESAAGKFPVEAVQMMDNIIKFTEHYEKYNKIPIKR